MSHRLLIINITIKIIITIIPIHIKILPKPSITSLKLIPVDSAKNANNARATAKLPPIFKVTIINLKEYRYLIIMSIYPVQQE